MLLKKKLAVALAVVMTAAVSLAGCGGGGETQQPAAEGGTAAAGKTKIVFGGWEDQIMARYLAERYMAEHPDVEIEVFNNGQWLGNENMAKLVAANQMPDIINLENPVYPIQNDWVIDLKPYLDKEGDVDLPENFIKYGTFNDKVVMVPNAVYLFGVMVNKTLLQANNIPIPDYGWTIDEFVDIAKKTTKPGQTIGTTEIEPIMKHLPPQMNDDLGWGAFNEVTRKYQLTPEWLEAANISYDLYKSNATLYERLDANGNPWDYEEGSQERTTIEEARANFLLETLGETDAGTAWRKGKGALWFDFTWGMNFHTNPEYSGFDWDYYPFPVKDKGDVSRPGIVVDSVAITTKCANPDAAWDFLKYMTFDKAGVEARFDIVTNYTKEDAQSRFPGLEETSYFDTLSFSFMPATTDQALIDKWVEFNNAKPGVKYMMSNMDTGFVDGFKVTPGFDEAYHKTIYTVYKEQVLTGQKSASDIIDEVAKLADDITAKAYAALGQ
ncbi:MAG: extracellular solute-binding protein [Clostridiales bacterium]|jgi:multiple sugar transport system substrate-binding protein|nr:extracellular solute-binding protein [Clostridiales bacterium]